jgi:hypothetical protein
VVRGGYAMYYTQIRANAIAGALTGGLDGLVTYTATPGQTGFPTCLTCVPLRIDPKTLPFNQQPARNITIQAGQRDFYKSQFASYGLNFDLLPSYPDEFVNPRSQVTSIGAERELGQLFAGADMCISIDESRPQRGLECPDAVRSHRSWTDADRGDRQRHATDRPGQRRRAERQRADESRDCRL